MACNVKLHGFSLFLLLLLLSSFFIPSFSDSVSHSYSQCESQISRGCHDKAESLKLTLIAIASILISSLIGVCLPMFFHAVPALRPDGNPFAVVKAFASGVILATGYMHVLPDSFDCLTSPCLPENPWRNFPFTTFVAMLSALLTLMVDSFSMSRYRKRFIKNVAEKCGGDEDGDDQKAIGNGCYEKGSELLRHRVVAQVLETGIVVHSVVIGLSMGASNNPCTIRPLIAALCFHQLFEGMGLGGCILQAEYGMKMKGVMVLFFSITTPFGIALGIGLSKVYNENSPIALIVVGILNASSAGLLNYMALVDLLASDFMGPKLQENLFLQYGLMLQFFWVLVACLSWPFGLRSCFGRRTRLICFCSSN